VTAAPGVHLRVDAAIALITLDRPGAKNALDRTTWAQLRAAIAEAAAAPVRVVALAGAGGSFSAGGDLKSIEERLALSADERRAQLIEDAAAIRALVEIPHPTVALLDGPAMGAGLALALACDVRLASQRSTLSCAFRKVGLATDFGLAWLLPRLIGRGRALDLLYSGDTLPAEQALQRGLLDRVYADDRFTEESGAYLRALAEGPASLPIIRRIVDEVATRTLDEAIGIEAGGQAEASRTRDAHEGARAFLERRAPRFRGE
jgi:2-(1,2-epoxy-1,2-dihydrophenyl)acetyl-CoA isomerase